MFTFVPKYWIINLKTKIIYEEKIIFNDVRSY